MDIKVGNYVIVKRQAYTKLLKLKEKGTITLGNFIIETENIIGEKYGVTFRMVSKTKKLYCLEKVEQINNTINIESSGTDNRNITDDGTSQTLTSDEINKLKDESLVSSEIVGKLISSSTSFNSKTEYSQEKYIKKKERKYFEYIQFLKPTIRLLIEMYYRQDSAKILGLRDDYLSQIITYGNIQSTGNYLLYDSGTSGLVPAMILNAIGKETEGKLIHMHPGNECQKSAVLAMQFPKEQQDRLINVNLYSVLRCFYQEKESYLVDEVPKKLVRTEDGPKKPGWHNDNERACRILTDKVDGVIITCKENPMSIVKELIQFLKHSRSIVVYHLYREPLQELFIYLKGTCDFISIRLLENFMRKYQVLPDRTHPEVNMTLGGYVLTGLKIS
nr:tRNA (adenine(58)-N(1))-methyltransferase non-catalytic subunit TRM6 [Onthophagus taurus]